MHNAVMILRQDIIIIKAKCYASTVYVAVMCLSVHQSVTLWYCTKMAKRTIICNTIVF